jgi:hypothetical protein
VKNYIVHDESGNILRTGVCQDDMMYLNARENETVIEGIASDKRHIVVNGKICDKPKDLDALKVELQERLRVTRNAKLSATDWTQHVDVDLTQDQVNAWKVYRKQLRDLPSKYEDLMDFENVIWPTQPA